MIFRVGIRYGDTQPDCRDVPWPLGKMACTPDLIELSVPWRNFRFPRKNIMRLLKYTGSLVVGVQIEHHVLEEPNYIVFWSPKFPELKKHLQDHGFTLS